MGKTQSRTKIKWGRMRAMLGAFRPKTPVQGVAETQPVCHTSTGSVSATPCTLSHMDSPLSCKKTVAARGLRNYSFLPAG